MSSGNSYGSHDLHDVEHFYGEHFYGDDSYGSESDDSDFLDWENWEDEVGIFVPQRICLRLKFCFTSHLTSSMLALILRLYGKPATAPSTPVQRMKQIWIPLPPLFLMAW